MLRKPVSLNVWDTSLDFEKLTGIKFNDNLLSQKKKNII